MQQQMKKLHDRRVMVYRDFLGRRASLHKRILKSHMWADTLLSQWITQPAKSIHRCGNYMSTYYLERIGQHSIHELTTTRRR